MVPVVACAVVYQVYPRSFSDHDGDGTGDILGIIIDRLPYLAQLGIDAIWVSPWYPSPMADGRYDVSDYRDIHPDFGTLEQADAFARAHDHGLRVLIDLVPSHSSDRHPLFQAALATEARLGRTSSTSSGTVPAPTAAPRRTTGGHVRRWGVEADHQSRRVPPGSGTCTCSPPSSRTGTGRTPR